MLLSVQLLFSHRYFPAECLLLSVGNPTVLEPFGNITKSHSEVYNSVLRMDAFTIVMQLLTIFHQHVFLPDPTRLGTTKFQPCRDSLSGAFSHVLPSSRLGLD
jgi:hypothetical protein